MTVAKAAGGMLVVFGMLAAQTPTQGETAQAQSEAGQNQTTPLYKVTVVGRTAQAVNYRHRGGATKIDFRGTTLMPEAKGQAKVESKQGYIEIEVEFEKISSPRKFGPEYLTYVMWAITPEGRPKNLGEVLLNGDRSKLNVTTDMQAFGLIVTAEPFFAVTQPSDVVVMENVIRRDTIGATEVVDAKYDLLPRGQYRYDPAAWQKEAVPLNTTTIPLEVYEARNAVLIAETAGATKYAADTIGKAKDLLRKSEDYATRKERKPAVMMAREAAQTAEDSRLLTLRRAEEERLANERQAAAEREERARMQAQQAEQDRLKAELQRRQAEAEAERSARQRAEAEAASAAALRQQQLAQAEAEKARLASLEAERMRQQAEQQQAELKARLQQQLNQVLETRESARGLIVNMNDVLFDFGKYTLRAEAREKLAKIAGILIAHPGLKLEVEGHTDSIGSEEFNQELSEKRAETVRDYLMQQGVNDVSARGFGKMKPIASNDTAAGRQQNRRVEMVVSGSPIGTQSTAGQ